MWSSEQTQIRHVLTLLCPAEAMKTLVKMRPSILAADFRSIGTWGFELSTDQFSRDHSYLLRRKTESAVWKSDISILYQVLPGIRSYQACRCFLASRSASDRAQRVCSCKQAPKFDDSISHLMFGNLWISKCLHRFWSTTQCCASLQFSHRMWWRSWTYSSTIALYPCYPQFSCVLLAIYLPHL